MENNPSRRLTRKDKPLYLEASKGKTGKTMELPTYEVKYYTCCPPNMTTQEITAYWHWARHII